MEIISHTSPYLEKQIVSLAVGVLISFLDILIAMKKGGGQGRVGDGVETIIWPRALCTQCSGWLCSILFPLLRHSWTRNSRTQRPGKAWMVPSHVLPCREKKLLQRWLYLIWLRWSAPPGLPVCSVIVDTRFKLPSTSLSCLIGRGGHFPAIYLSAPLSSSFHIHLLPGVLLTFLENHFTFSVENQEIRVQNPF